MMLNLSTQAAFVALSLFLLNPISLTTSIGLSKYFNGLPFDFAFLVVFMLLFLPGSTETNHSTSTTKATTIDYNLRGATLAPPLVLETNENPLRNKKRSLSVPFAGYREPGGDYCGKLVTHQ